MHRTSFITKVLAGTVAALVGFSAEIEVREVGVRWVATAEVIAA